MYLKEIKENVLKETGITSEMYDMVIADFWKKLKQVLQDAPNILMGIRIAEFGTFTLNYWTLKRYVQVWKGRNERPKVTKIRYTVDDLERMLIKLEPLVKTYKNEQKKPDNE